MIYRIVIILLIAAYLQSCDNEFSLEGMDTQQKTVLFCFPTTKGDTTLIQVSQSTSVNNQMINIINKPSINFTVNGREKEIKFNEKPTAMLPPNSYYVLGELKEKDRINIEVSYPDLTVAKSETEIPEPFPLIKAEIALKNGDYGKEIHLVISFKDNAATKDYYGIRVLRKKITEYMSSNKQNQIEYAPVELKVDKEPLLSDKTGFDDIFGLSKEYYRFIYIWDDNMVNGKEYTLNVGTGQYPGSKDEYQKETYEFKIFLYKLSEELYKYIKSINDINNNELGNYGLAPIRSHFTNIENGIGILGGCNIYESEWLDIPEE